MVYPVRLVRLPIRPALVAAWGFLALCGPTLPRASADDSAQNDPALFQRVAKQLDQDGKYFLYQDKAELERELIRRFNASSMSFIYAYRSEDEELRVRRARIDGLTNRVATQLTDNLSAVGESIKAGNGFYCRKSFVATEASPALLTSFFPHPPNNLDALSLLPADTDFFLYHQIEPRVLMQSITEFGQIFGLNGLSSNWEALEQELDQMTGLSDTLDAMGTELAIMLKFSQERVNAAEPADIKSLIRRTQCGLILHPPDQRLTEHLKTRATTEPNSKIVEFEGVTIYSNFLPKLGDSSDIPAFADVDGWLIFAINPDVVKNMIATKKGQIPSLRADTEFQRLSAGLTAETNGCFFASTQFGQDLEKMRDALTGGDRTSQSASQIGLAISLDFFTRVISNLFDGYGISKQIDHGYQWEVHERKPNGSGVDQILTSLFSILAGYAVASH